MQLILIIIIIIHYKFIIININRKLFPLHTQNISHDYILYQND